MAEESHKVLIMLFGSVPIGRLEQDRNGRFGLAYEDQWQSDPAAFPVSLSMPLGSVRHTDAVVRAFLWGLLPDNEAVLERWARSYQVSARNPFGLLEHVGEECAGAVQFVRPERVEDLIAGHGGVDWIDEAGVAERLRVLDRDPTAWHLSPTMSGQFSLAGAQAKIALHFDRQSRRWGDPWGVVPTTHILKPAIRGFAEHDLNEHLCLVAARHAGLGAARSHVASFEDQRAIVVERYDRVDGAGRVNRVHQEDACQALGKPPTIKYQNEGGPSANQIAALLRESVRPRSFTEQDTGRFVDALAFNWIIAGTDAHAKNYSVLLASGQVRLAPLYDLASALPYDEMFLPKLRMAMKIGGEYRLEGVAGRHWRRFATENKLDPDAVVERVNELVERVPQGFQNAADTVSELGSPLPDRLVKLVATRAQRCADALRAG